MNLEPDVFQTLPKEIQSLLSHLIYTNVSWMSPEKKPTSANSLRLIQTHISYVVLTGGYTFKLKKDVNMGFLDFSSLEKREHFCRREVQLNRRFAPDYYLGVAPIGIVAGNIVIGDLDPCFEEIQTPRREGGEVRQHIEASETIQTNINSDMGTISFIARLIVGALAWHEEITHPCVFCDLDVLEWCVVMKEFDQSWILQHRLENGTASRHDMSQLGKQLAVFHDHGCECCEEIAHFGMPHELKAAFDQNYEQTEQFVGSLQTRKQLDATRDLSNSFFFNRSNLLADRVRHGKIKRCHVRWRKFVSPGSGSKLTCPKLLCSIREICI